MSFEHDYHGFVFGRTRERIIGGAVSAVLLFPILRLVLVHAGVNRFVVALWTPKARYGFVIGGIGGFLEDRQARLAWHDVHEIGFALEPPMWTMRTLVPALAFFANPFLALKACDGEMKGADTALASLEGRAFRMWPFYAVVDTARPSVLNSNLRFCSPPHTHTPSLAPLPPSLSL